MKRWYMPLGVLVTLGVVAAGLWGLRSAMPAAVAAQSAPPTVAVERGEVSLSVTAPGRLVGTREMVLSFGATGKLADLRVRAGQHVEEGATLARLDPAPLEERVVTAQTELELARARLAKLQAGPTPADMAAGPGDLGRALAGAGTPARRPEARAFAAPRPGLGPGRARRAIDASIPDPHPWSPGRMSGIATPSTRIRGCAAAASATRSTPATAGAACASSGTSRPTSFCANSSHIRSAFVFMAFSPNVPRRPSTSTWIFMRNSVRPSGCSVRKISRACFSELAIEASSPTLSLRR